MSGNRLLNKLLCDDSFLVDEASVPYIIRDIINMNWWNTCGYLLGYTNNKRLSADATFDQKMAAILLKEFYRYRIIKDADPNRLLAECEDYILGKKKALKQLGMHSMPYRRNDSQYFHKNGKPTFVDCTSRATYAWKYIGQNGYIDFDGVCRVIDGNKIIDFLCSHSGMPNSLEYSRLFAQGTNQVKEEIFSQRDEQYTVSQWVVKLGIEVIASRQWLYDAIQDVKTDPYKNNEKKMLAEGRLIGVNEALYGFSTMANKSLIKASGASRASRAGNVSSASRASGASHASGASDASNASHASRASDASRASYASAASSASDAGTINTPDQHTANNWYEVKAAIGPLSGLDHPPMFLKNKYGMAGNWKINADLVAKSQLGWFDPFMGHGTSPLYAKRHGKNYVGIEINPDSMNGFLLPYVQKAVTLYGDPNARVELRLGDSAMFYADLVNRFDLCYTSPPYFNFEDYGFHNKVIQDCIDYDEYHRRVTIPVFSNVLKYLIDGGVLALQTEKNKTLKDKWVQVITCLGFTLLDDTITGQEANKYSTFSKRDQSLLIFRAPRPR